MLRIANKEVCYCEKMQGSLRTSIFEAILQGVTAETRITIHLDTLQ